LNAHSNLLPIICTEGDMANYDEKTIQHLTDLFSAVADPTRARIILLILDAERRSGEIAAALDMTPSAVSHQLRWLRERRIVVARREGRETYYQLADDCIRSMVQIALQHICEEN
jgi:ArsR family transcriptional regulator